MRFKKSVMARYIIHNIYAVEFSTYLNQCPNSNNCSKVTVHLGLKIAPAFWPVHSFLPGFPVFCFSKNYIHTRKGIPR